MSVLMDKNLKSDLILFAAICFPPVSLFWLNHCSTTCIEQSCIRVKEHLPITDQNMSWTWGSLASAGQHFKCSMATLGAQLHPYLISSPTSLISPTTNTELMVSALPRIQTDPNTSSLPKMQLQAVASSSAKIFPANQPGHISKCKCQTNLQGISQISHIGLNEIPGEDLPNHLAEPGSLLNHHISTSFGVADLSLTSPVDTTEVAARWVPSLTSTAHLI